MPVIEIGFGTKRAVQAITRTKVAMPLVEPKYIKLAIENVHKNVDLEFQLLNDMQPVKDKSAAVVGAGQWDINDILAHETVFAVGKRAATRLNAAGRQPDFLIITGHGQTGPLPPATHYFIAAMCDTKLLSRYPSTMFHAVIDGYGSHYHPKGQAKIPGGISAGLTAINIVFVMGYREMHLFGYDSSGEGDIILDVEGDRFNTTFSLFQQAANFTRSAQILCNKGVRIFVHGTGLLPKLITGIYEDEKTPPDEAVYSLIAMGASFDFVTWLINAEMYRRRHKMTGPLRVRFLCESLARELDGISTPQQGTIRSQMLDNVMRPSMRMIGAVEDDTITDSNRNFDCYYIEIAKNFRNGEKVPKFKCRSPVERSDKLVVITLREAAYILERNSNLDAWQEFARKRQAEGYEILFIRDTAKADEPMDGWETHREAAIDLEARQEVYSRAFCNVSIATGPTSLLMFSDNPFLIMVPIGKFDGYDPWTAEWMKVACGIDVTKEDQYAWFTHDQRFSWVDDTAENIELAWSRWLELSSRRERAA